MKRLSLLLLLGLFAISAIAQQTHVLAGIEIGGSGIKGLAVEVTDGGDGYSVKEVYKRQINVQLIAGLKDGTLQEDRIKLAATAVSELAEEIKKIDPEFLVVAASTAFAQVKNRDALASAVKEASYQTVDFIRTEDEVYYGMLACIPERRLKYSVLLDVGGSNSKAGYETRLARNGFEAVTFPYGSKTLEDAAKKGGDGALKKILTTDVAKAVKEAASDRPGLSNGSRPVYIIGGASWAAANIARPLDIDRPFVTLKLSELSALNKKLEQKDLHDEGVLPSKLSEAAESEIRKVEDAFNPDRLRAGIGLLVTILESMSPSKGGTSERQIVFPRQTAEAGWMYGYMFGKFNAAHAPADQDKKK